MAQLKIGIDDFFLVSQWNCSLNSSGFFIDYGPTTATKTVVLGYALPAGATINSAIVYAELGSALSGVAFVRANGVALNDGAADVTADATASQLTVQFSFRANGQISQDTATHAGSLAFSNVYVLIDYTPPNSEWFLGTATVEAGGSVSITIVPVDAAFSHRLNVQFGSVATTYDIEAGVTDYELDVPMEWLNQMPDTASSVATVTLQTLSDGTVLGTSENRMLTITCPASVVPIPGVLSVTPVDAKWGLFVQGYSAAKIALTGAEGQYGASIKSVSITGGGYSANQALLTTGVLRTTGENKFIATVMDSRGRIAATGVSITVTGYTAPLIRETMHARADETGAASNEGTYLNAAVVYTYTAIGENATTVTMRYRLYGTSDWADGYSGALESGRIVHFGGGMLANDQTYELMMTVSDAITSASTTRTIGPAAAYVYWNPRNSAVGFGCRPSDTKTVQIAENWTLKIGTQTLNDLIASIVTCECPKIVAAPQQPAEPTAGMIWLDIS